MGFSENDLREIERSRDLPPDELYGSTEEEPQEGSCEHLATKLIRVYLERREVCVACGETLQTVTVPYGAWFCIHGRFNGVGCPECEGRENGRDVT